MDPPKVGALKSLRVATFWGRGASGDFFPWGGGPPLLYPPKVGAFGPKIIKSRHILGPKAPTFGTSRGAEPPWENWPHLRVFNCP